MLVSGIIDYPTALKRFHSDFFKSLIWLILHLLRKKKQFRSSDIQITEENTVQTERKSFNFQPLSDKTLPLTDLTPSSTNRKTRKARESKMKTDNLDQFSPSMGSLASILASDSESPRKNSKRKLASEKAVPLPGSMGQSDDLWELNSDSSDSGFGLEVKNIFARAKASATLENKGTMHMRDQKLLFYDSCLFTLRHKCVLSLVTGHPLILNCIISRCYNFPVQV